MPEVKLKVASSKSSISNGAGFSYRLINDLEKLAPAYWSAINNPYVEEPLKLETNSAAGPKGRTPAVITFNTLPAKKYGDLPFVVTATSTNPNTAITFASSNTAVATVANTTQGWKVTIKAAGTANIIASQAEGGKFGAAAPVSRALVVSTIPAVITFGTLPAKTVGDGPFLLIATSTNTTTPISFTSSNTAVATVAKTTEGWKATIIGAGTANIVATQAAGGNYSAAALVSRALTVAPGITAPVPAVISFPTLVAKKFGDAPFFLQATSTNTGTPIAFASSNPAVVSVANTTEGWKASIIGAGTATITASQAAGNGYAAASNVSQVQVVAAIPAVITFAPLLPKLVGDAPILLTATSTNTGTPITFASSNSAVATVANTPEGWKATIVGAGTATITASQVAGGNYTAAASVSNSLVVNEVVATPSVISFSALASKKVGDVPFLLTASSTNSVTPITFASSNASVVTVANTMEGWKATIVGAGTATIIASQAAGNGYAAATSVSQPQVVSTIPAVITFNALPAKTMGDAPFLLNATSTNTATPIAYTSSNPAVATVAQTTEGWKATIVGAGTATITASQAAGGNYASASPVSRALVVSAPVETVTPPSPEAFVQGVIPYKSYWGYHKDKSNQSIDKLFNGVINETVHMGTSEMLPEADIVLNFPDAMEVELQKISFYDGQGTIPVGYEIQTIYVEKGTGREIVGPSYNGSKFNYWIDHALTTPIRVSAVILRKKKGVRLPDEIRLYGKYKPYTPPSFTKPAYPLKRMLGINTYPADNASTIAERLVQKINAIAPYHVVRDYVDWEILETNLAGEYAFQPTMKGNWKLDDIYARHKAKGKEVLVCIKNMPGWMLATYPTAIRDAENAPMPYKASYTTVSSTGSTNYFNEQYNADKQNPASYVQVAKVAFQFAARYGSNTSLNPALVKTKSIVKIGMNLISKMEANNEPDRHWKGRQANQTSDEYAAYLSAFYDGHMGTLGADVGVKQADPNMKVVCAGIASTKTAFYQGIVDWCKKYRGYLPNGKVNLCFDEINYHAYNNNFDGEQYAEGTRVGVAPELSLAPLNINKFHQINKEFIGDGDMPIIITETGYDWNSTTQGTKVIGSKDKFQVQGDWILRSSLDYAMAGLSGLYFYQLYDDPSGSITNTTQYATSGHVDRVTFVRRPAADYMGQVWKYFGDFVPVERLSKDPRIDKYRDNAGREMYAAWIPDDEDRRSDYTLALGTDSANVFYTRIGSDSMEVVKVKTVAGKLTVTVTETPIFILATGQPVFPTEMGTTNAPIAIAPQLTVETKLNIFPNPFSRNTTLEFQVGETSEAVLDVFDSQGKLVKHLFVGKAESGVAQTMQFNAGNLPNGVYIARLTTGKKTISKKLLLMK
ncbi:T9SS type A sorting domain-containing protein [Rufibacter latericius]|uniref:T9SS type A sorting domain-containing protein n=1 Tax=Rufibacter latericius TaxID=2487040 RepID=UPI001401D9B9|nr:T9SS type A sorting domain-containing protein [Rufibacter latericius]